jgi:hypothetical protein
MYVDGVLKQMWKNRTVKYNFRTRLRELKKTPEGIIRIASLITEIRI